MNTLKSYFRRCNLALRGKDDHRLINRVRAPLAALADELGAERDRLVSQLAERVSQQDHLARQLAACVAERDQLAARVSEQGQIAGPYAECAAERDRLAGQLSDLNARYSELVAQHERNTAQMNHLVAQDSARAGIILERDQLAAQLAEARSASGAAGERLLRTNLENLRERYLDLTESALIGAIYKDPPIPIFGRDSFDESIRGRGLDWPKNAFSMIGAARMRNFRTSVERAILTDIPGDIVETGVWRGGASILARAVLAAYGVTDRKVILADSFEGLPPPDKVHYPADADSNFHEFPDLAVSLEQVRENFEKFGLLDDQVHFLKGWFKDTMPHVPTERIAILRLDGDMYESTIDPLTHLYDKVSPGGWIIVDDYEWVPACKSAVDDFLSGRGLKPDIQQIDGVGVFFQKIA